MVFTATFLCGTEAPVEMDRRTYCRRAGVAGLAALAGCFGPQATDNGDGGDDASPDAAGNRTSDTGRTTDPGGGPAGSRAGTWPSFGVDHRNIGVASDGVGPATAEHLWAAIDDAPTVLCGPTVADGTVYVGSAADALHAVDADTGEERWRYGTASYVPAAPEIVDGTSTPWTRTASSTR